MSATLRDLLDAVPPLSADLSLNAVTERFQTGGFGRVLSLAIVDEEHRPIGVISRHALMELLLNKYSRDLYGKRAIRYFMNPDPVIVSLAEGTSAVVTAVTSQLRTPVIEDFIFTEADGRYAGLGYVADVLKLVEQRLAQRNQALAKANEEIRASQAHLVQSEKMAALGQMVAGVAHEINTPLGYVGNNVQMAEELITQVHELVEHYDGLFAELMNPQADSVAVETRIGTLSALREEFDAVAELRDLSELFSDTRFGRGCKNFCVNGPLAGNCRIARSDDDDRSETRRT